MAAKDFLVEIGCAELPPKALRTLSRAFSDGIRAELDKADLAHGETRAFATPRRLAVLVSALQLKQDDVAVEKFGPAVKAAFGEDGEPTKAAQGFARSCGVAVQELERGEKDGVEKLLFRSQQKGRSAAELLPEMVSRVLHRLPIPKKMRWGSNRDEFVRPVYWLLMLLGSDVLPSCIMGVEAGRQTRGHRFHHPGTIELESAAEYERSLEKARVLADYEKRKQRIREQVEAEGRKQNATVIIENDLLEEVCSLVEWPVAVTGRFDEHFLEVPPEALISSLKQHQKCFYLVDEQRRLLPAFITVANIESRDPAQVIAGNERVIRPRLADAAFFYETDCSKPLSSHLEALKTIVFQQQLGTVHDKSLRVSALAGFMADQLQARRDWAERAALLAKCDLLTQMVSEFAELQGIMGCYYARKDGEAEEVALALNEQYMPRFSGDALPSCTTGAVLALAEKLDTIVGLFAIGQPPTGSKDPYALRRAALGLLRIIVEKELDLNLRDCITQALTSYENLIPDLPADVADQVFEFLLERFRAWYREEGVSADVFQAVFELRPARPLDFNRRIQAVHRFTALPESEALAAANKRVANILQKEDPAQLPAVEDSLLSEPAEIELARTIDAMTGEVEPLFARGDYTEGLEKLAATKSVIDHFFDEVLVMAEDEALRNNRLTLLVRLRALFLQVADISCLHRG